MPTDLKITTAMLYQGALLFALLDAVCVPLLLWRVRRETFARLKWELALSAALVWLGIWSWAIGNFWETVYVYVFPAWARIGVPPLAFGIAGLVALGLWAAAMRFRGQPAPVYFLCGAALGSLSHAWALTRGLMTKPPMLQGASPLGRWSLPSLSICFTGASSSPLRPPSTGFARLFSNAPQFLHRSGTSTWQASYPESKGRAYARPFFVHNPSGEVY